MHEPPPPAATAGAIPPLPPRVIQRLAVAFVSAERNTQEVAQRLQSKQALLDALVRLCQVKPLGKMEALRRVRRLVDAWAAEVLPSSACRRQCSHCCHVAVAVFETEAKAIATAVKQRVSAPLHDWSKASKQEFTQAFGQPRPCVFLRDGRCSIYQHRPLACRVLFSLDDDELLCDVQPSMQVDVPQADATGIHLLTASLFFNDRVADIRDWFSSDGLEMPAP